MILELDPTVGCISPLSGVSHVKLASREDAGGWEKARLTQEDETSFLHNDKQVAMQEPNNDHLGNMALVQRRGSFWLSFFTFIQVAAAAVHQQSPAGSGNMFLWQPHPLFRGLGLSLVGASSVVHFLSALGGMAFCSCHLCRPRGFFLPF